VITLIFLEGDNSSTHCMRLKFKKEDEDFSVIESETLVIFSGYTKQNFRTN
jgi:hypothetical protein